MSSRERIYILSSADRQYSNSNLSGEKFYFILRCDVYQRLTVRVKMSISMMHDDVIKWKHFPRNWPFVRGIHRSPVNSPHKGQWRAALMFSLICVWINDWINNREAGVLRRHRDHYDAIVMVYGISRDIVLRKKTHDFIDKKSDSANGLKPWGNKPLSVSVLTEIFIVVWHCIKLRRGSSILYCDSP